jgi:hypothetical protein
LEPSKNDPNLSDGPSEKMPEPKLLEGGKLKCPICSHIFGSRQDYDSHILGVHPSQFSMASGSSGSMQTDSEEKCNETALGTECAIKD